MSWVERLLYKFDPVAFELFGIKGALVRDNVRPSAARGARDG